MNINGDWIPILDGFSCVMYDFELEYLWYWYYLYVTTKKIYTSMNSRTLYLQIQHKFTYIRMYNDIGSKYFWIWITWIWMDIHITVWLMNTHLRSIWKDYHLDELIKLNILYND